VIKHLTCCNLYAINLSDYLSTRRRDEVITDLYDNILPRGLSFVILVSYLISTNLPYGLWYLILNQYCILYVPTSSPVNDWDSLIF